MLPRIVFAGVASGVGKTTITAAFIAHARAQGLRVQPFKVGPDYIDPSHLAFAASRPCYNLDTWMMPQDRMLDMFCTTATTADIAVIEGMMGLYDGQSSTSNAGSTAEIARILQAPVVLVIDAGAMARSAAAIVLGFQRLDPEVRIAGVIANRVGGSGHAQLLREAIELETGIPLLGYFSSSSDKLLPERHLGLVPISEQSISTQQLTEIRGLFEQTCDSEKLLALAYVAPPLELCTSEPFLVGETRGKRVRIALAQDEAFNFYYPDTLNLLRLAGAELVPFSPIHNSHLPENIGGVYLGGGFPEEHARTLSANVSMREALAQLLRKGLPCYAECGGLMYLCQSLRTADGETLPMVGAVARECIVDQGRLTIGYREATALRDTLLTRRGEMVRGHEFHVSSLKGPVSEENAAYAFQPTEQREGLSQGNLLATYLHLSFSGFPQAAERFADAAHAWQMDENEQSCC